MAHKGYLLAHKMSIEIFTGHKISRSKPIEPSSDEEEEYSEEDSYEYDKPIKTVGKPAARHAVFIWDFTWNNPPYPDELDEIKNTLKKMCKKWVFQLERGKLGTPHLQGRVSLKVKVRAPSFFEQVHWSITSEKAPSFDYAEKDDTRIAGPWKWDDVKIYIPRQIREIGKLWPWQQQVIDSRLLWNTRSINFIVDTVGNKGKSIVATYAMAHRLGWVLPFANDFRDIMRMALAAPPECRSMFIIDLPRALKKDTLYQFMAGIEDLKNGRIWDDRYKFRLELIDSPQIWIFVNKTPDTFIDKGYLSNDRFVWWEINDAKILQTYAIGEE